MSSQDRHSFQITWSPHPYIGRWCKTHMLIDGQRIEVKQTGKIDVYAPLLVYKQVSEEALEWTAVLPDYSIISSRDYPCFRFVPSGPNSCTGTEWRGTSIEAPSIIGEHIEMWATSGTIVVKRVT